MKPTGARVSTARLQPKLNRKDNAMPKITRRPPCHLMVCPNCASSDVAIDATAKWDVEAQEWELSSTQDTITCQACGSEGYEAEFSLSCRPTPTPRPTCALRFSIDLDPSAWRQAQTRADAGSNRRCIFPARFANSTCTGPVKW